MRLTRLLVTSRDSIHKVTGKSLRAHSRRMRGNSCWRCLLCGSGNESAIALIVSVENLGAALPFMIVRRVTAHGASRTAVVIVSGNGWPTGPAPV